MIDTERRMIPIRTMHLFDMLAAIMYLDRADIGKASCVALGI